MCGPADQDRSTAPTARAVSRRSVLIAAGATLGAAAVGRSLFGPTDHAAAAGTYLRPCGDVRISSSWQGHKNRNPPSGEPGTDYAVPTGTPIQAATDGVIVDRKDSTGTATGRYLALRATDGNYIRYLHLQSSAVRLGERVARGQVIAYSGASGFGSETGYGAHVHVSLWIGGTPSQLGFTNSVDFENYVVPSTTPPPDSEDPVPTHQSSAYWWNTAVPMGVWARIPIAPGSFYLAQTGVGSKETGDLTLYLRAIGVTTGLQVRVVAETLDSIGNIVSSTMQPVIEIPATTAASATAATLGHYSLPYFLSGPLRLYAELRVLNAGITVQQVDFKKNFWRS